MAEVDNGSDALETVRKLLPDLIILDLSIPNMDGFAVISCLKSIGLAVKVLILTSGDSRNFAMRCLQAGAAGFICKDDNLDELVGAVKAVLSGYSYFLRTPFSCCGKMSRRPTRKAPSLRSFPTVK